MTDAPARPARDTAADSEESGHGPTVAPPPHHLDEVAGTLTPDQLREVDTWWRAANYLAVGQIYLDGQPAADRARSGASTSSPGCSATSGRCPGSTSCGRTRTVRSATGTSRPSSSPGPVTAVPGPNACAWLEGTYSERSSHHPAGRGRDAPRSSGSSRSRAACRATARRRRRARSTRVASSATRSCTRAVPRSTTPTSSSSAWSATARPRPVRSRRAGTRPGSCNPARDGAVLPILHLNEFKIANPTLLARIPRGGAASACCVAAATTRASSPAPTPARSTRRWPPRSTTASTTSPDERARAARGDDPGEGWRRPMIVLRTPKGWTCPPDRRRPAGGGDVPRAPGAASRTPGTTTSTARVLEEWLRSYRTRGAVRTATAGRTRRCSGSGARTGTGG